MKILFLTTWFPYPPTQGSKIRAYNLLRSLSEENEIYLISFCDNPVEKQWITHLKKYCNEIVIVNRKPFDYSRFRKFLGFFSPLPSAVVAGYSEEMRKTVQKIAETWKPDMAFALTFVTAPYALQIPDIYHVVDMDNLLALMLKDLYKESKGGIEKIRRYLAYWKFKNYENKIYRKFDLALVCSELDKIRALNYIQLDQNKIISIPNGVEVNHQKNHSISSTSPRIIFNGSLSYWPNFDAMNYFISEIFPLILEEIPDCQLLITGKTDNVEKLPPINGKVVFTGFVEDINSLVSSCDACVVPLRHGAGTRLKILEAMAVGTPVITTSKGAEGLEVINDQHLLIKDNPHEFAAATIQVLRNTQLKDRLTREARKLVKTCYDWRIIGEKLNRAIKNLTIQQ